jgi:RNA polymerase sigma-70 factor (ECF subfamily)
MSARRPPVAQNLAEPDCETSAAVKAVRAGDVQAFVTIVKRFGEALLTLCVTILHDSQAAEELAQDVFVRAFHRLDTYDVRQPMKPWLVKIAYRMAQERWRQKQREAVHCKAAAQSRKQPAQPDPSHRLVATERSDILWQEVHALPLAQRTAVVLYYRENMTVKDVARTMGVSPGTVKTHLFRARTQIQESLRARGFEEEDLA